MMIEICFLKGAERMFAFSFAVSDKSEVPEYFKNAVAAFYEAVPGLSLLDPDVSIKVEAPLNKDMPLYA